MKKRFLAFGLIFSLLFTFTSCIAKDAINNDDLIENIEFDDFEVMLTLNGEHYYAHEALECSDTSRLTYIGKTRLQLVGNNDRYTVHSVYVYPNEQDPMFVYCSDVGVFADHSLYNPADDFSGFTEYSGATVSTIKVEYDKDDTPIYEVVKKENYTFDEPLNFKELFTGKVIEFSTVSASDEYSENEYYEFDFKFKDGVPLVKNCKAYKYNGVYHVAYFNYWDGYGISGYDDNFYYELTDGVLNNIQ